MYCPRCGQQHVNYETRFCSQCGFLMNGMLEVISKGGLPSEVFKSSDPNAVSPRKRGIKQGGLLMLSSLILVPLSIMLTVMLNVEPFAVVFITLFTFWGGFLRILYAAIFQSGNPTTEDFGFFQSLRQELTGKRNNLQELATTFSADANSEFQQPRVGNWRETSDLHPTGEKPLR